MESLSKEENDESGPFTLAAAITEAIGSGSDSEEETETETIVEGESSASQVEAESETEAAEDAKETRLVVLASSQFLTSNADSAVSGGNTKLLTNALSWMCGQSSSISIPSKSMQLSYLTLTSASVNLWSILTIAVLPAAFLVIGGVIWLKRRKKIMTKKSFGLAAAVAVLIVLGGSYALLASHNRIQESNQLLRNRKPV